MFFPVVAFATKRPPVVAVGRHWWCVEGLFSCAARLGRVARRVGCPILFGGGASRLPTTEREIQPPPRRARWGFVREASPCSSQLGRCPIGRGAAAFGARQSPFQTPLKFRSPAPRGKCESSPQSRLNCALPLGAAAARRLVVPCSSQRWLCRVPFGGVGSCFAFPNDCPCAFHPRARLVRAPLVPKVCEGLV